MTTKLVTPSLGKNAVSADISEELLDKNLVIFLQGKNVFGDRIYSYLELTLRSLRDLKAKMDSGADFSPSDFGTVLAAGTGYPSDEIKQEMAEKYNMVDLPPPRPASVTVAQPGVWGDEEGDIF